ncbi:MAG: hypothetical protein OEM39_08055 [Acidimicrobiia bacterium]|nr:hypothetical protein [Acidimicrobiia bacterium]MDH3462865.1 hypothetical protein [Acidimicrobiia bacterium]
MAADKMGILAEQLGRMRGMTRYYHERFFADTRFFSLVLLALLVVGWWGVPETFLLVPLVAILAANVTAFDASYLIFARKYAATLEAEINQHLGADWLIAARMEDAYLFPLDKPKVVTIRLGEDFSWFGWMTILYTLLGAALGLVGLAAGWATLRGLTAAWFAAYVIGVASLTIGSLVIGSWWFGSGAGEARLTEVIESRFGKPVG